MRPSKPADLTPGMVLARIKRGEGQKTEFKESFSLRDDIIRSLGAFANAKGGTVFIGVRNNATLRGAQVGVNTLENLANDVARSTQHPLHPEIEQFDIEGNLVVTATVEAEPSDSLIHVSGVAFIRVGRTNQVLSPEEVRRRLFEGFRAQNLLPSVVAAGKQPEESWAEREERRIRAYESNRGLFIVHTWQPCSTPGQVADIILSIRQHPGPDQPLLEGHLKSVEWHPGPRFFKRTVVETDEENSFRLEVSAYGPLLCLARVNFDDGSPPLDLERYVEF